ncbi:MAG: SDR family NAD(P)-dependent oxidoreductase [Vicinamibacterales bacterium]
MWSVAGKTVVVTGATSGIGLEAARVLAGAGAQLVMVGRSRERLAAARALVGRGAQVPPETYEADFASLRSVNGLADAFLRDLPRIDVLINNAGSVFARRTLTVDGIEATFAVNHLAPMLLTQRLLPLLANGAPSRVITVASGRHFKGTLDFDDLGFARGYQILRAYARSKLANVMFASELARRTAGTSFASYSLHPGRVATNIWSGAPRWSKPLITYWLSRTFISVEDGAAPVVALAIRDDLPPSGAYFDRFEPADPSALALDAALASRLWDESERLIAGALSGDAGASS